MVAAQKAEIEKMMRRGGTDPWAVNFDKSLEGKDINDPTETLKDSAAAIGDSFSTKKFSF